MSLMHCKNCGRPLVPGDEYCACGQRVRGRSVPSSPFVNKRNVQQRGQRQRVERLRREGGVGKCHWCGRLVVSVAAIPVELRVSVSTTQVRWKEDDVIRTAWVATADHVTAVADGGKNGKNIVISCAHCNQDRKSKVAIAIEDGVQSRNGAAWQAINWFTKVGATVRFGPVTSVEICHENEVVVAVEDASFQSVLKTAREMYGRWHVAKFGAGYRKPT